MRQKAKPIPSRATALERWLLRYHDAVAEEQFSAQRIDTLEAYSRNATRRITGMPNGHNGGEVLPMLIDEREKLRRKIGASQAVKSEVLAALELLPSGERRLLTAYYVQGQTWEMAAEAMPCSPKSVPLIKRRALRRLAALLGVDKITSGGVK